MKSYKSKRLCPFEPLRKEESVALGPWQAAVCRWMNRFVVLQYFGIGTKAGEENVLCIRGEGGFFLPGNVCLITAPVV